MNVTMVSYRKEDISTVYSSSVIMESNVEHFLNN